MSIAQIGRWIFALTLSLAFHGLVVFAVAGGCTSASGPECAKADGAVAEDAPTADSGCADEVSGTKAASTASASTPGKTVSTVPALTPGKSADDGWIDYRVRTGDTLSGLAKRYGVTARELAERNGTDPTTLARLRIGQVIRVPAAVSATSDAAPTVSRPVP